MLVAGAVLPACTSHVSDDLSVEGLGKSGDAVITMAAVLDSDRERTCTNVGFEPLDSKTRTELYTQLPGRRFYRITLKLGTGTVLDAGNEIVGSMQIAPGAYKVAGALCQSSRGKVEVVSADPRGFATFSVAAGEVVNLGKLILLEVPTDRFVVVPHVAPLKTDPRTRLNKDLAARLVDRLLTPSQPPLPKAELARICEHRRANPTLVIAPPSPSNVCALAGL